jgi:hypothetical protein
LVDLNTMLREHARSGIKAQLDAAVVAGDSAAAQKAADELAKFEIALQPPAAKGEPYTVEDRRIAMEKVAPWFGVDPVKTARAMELSKHLDVKKFATADAFATAVRDAVDKELEPKTAKTEEGEGEDDEEGDGGGTAPPTAAPPKRKTGGADDLGPGPARSSSKAWTKLTDAPTEVRQSIQRQVDKMVPRNAKPEVKALFITRALESAQKTHKAKA